MERVPNSSGENFAKILRTWQINSLIGKLMLIIETMGLQKGQEESVKSLIKQEIWKEFNEGFYISEAMCEQNAKANDKQGFVTISH